MKNPLEQREVAAQDMLSAMANFQALNWAGSFLFDTCQVLRSELQPVPTMFKTVKDRTFLKFLILLGNIDKPSSPAYQVAVVLSLNGWATIALGNDPGFFHAQPPEIRQGIHATLIDWYCTRFQRHPKIRWTGRPALFGDGTQSWVVAVEHNQRLGFCDQFEVFFISTGDSAVVPLDAPLISLDQVGQNLTVGKAFFDFDMEAD